MKQKWKIVSVKECIGIIILSLIFLISVSVIPCTVDGKESVFFLGLPLINANDVATSISEGIVAIANVIGIDAAIYELIYKIIVYAPTVYTAILLFDILASLILSIFRTKPLRIIFRIFSIIFGFAMIYVFLSSLVSMIGIIFAAAKGSLTASFVLSGFISVAMITIFSFFMILKQFKWFRRPYNFEFKNRNEIPTEQPDN